MRPPPALALLVLAPFIGEVLSLSTPLSAFPLPQYLLFEAALYGGGALVIREVVRRRALGLRGMLLLGAAYGVLEEALVVRSWFAPEYFTDPAASAYSRVWGTNVLMASHLTLFHAVVSVWCSITVVELLFPRRRATAWAGRRGLGAAGLGMLVVLGLSLGSGAFFAVPVPQFLAAAGLMTVLGALAIRSPGGRGRARAPRSAWRLAGVTGLAVTAHFLTVWTLPSAPVPWPAGLVLALVPPAAALAWGHGRVHTDHERWAVVAGLAGPFILLQAVVGTARPDALATAILATAGLILLRRRVRGGGARIARGQPSGTMSPKSPSPRR
ncbi:MAG: hypothetical protein U0237_06570 [Thermoleophilia bacterium]